MGEANLSFCCLNFFLSAFPLYNLTNSLTLDFYGSFHYKRKLLSIYNEIYYHKGTGECDFIVLDKGKISQAIQVCFHLNSDNRERELAGLVDALRKYHLSEGILVTLSQEDLFEVEGFRIQVVPSYKYLQM